MVFSLEYLRILYKEMEKALSDKDWDEITVTRYDYQKFANLVKAYAFDKFLAEDDRK